MMSVKNIDATVLIIEGKLADFPPFTIPLQKKGFDAFLMETVLAEPGGTWHRVFLGRYADEQKAQEAARLAKSQYKLNAVVVRNAH